MNIFDQIPSNWHELQDLVSKVFEQIGCETYVEHEIQTARGVSKVDVYVNDIENSPPLIYVCECKYWSSRVPKAIVHQVRSIVSDAGANFGLIISINGFQKGAYESAKNTNIQLLAWEEFQELFFERWFNNRLKALEKPLQSLFYYLDGSNENLDDLFNWTCEDLEEYEQLRQKHRWLLDWHLHTNYGIPLSTFFSMTDTKYKTHREFINTIVVMGQTAGKEINAFFRKRGVKL